LTPRPPSPTLFPYTTLFRSKTTPVARRPTRGNRRSKLSSASESLVAPHHLSHVIHASSEATLAALPSSGPALADERGLTSQPSRSEEHTSELQSRSDLVCRL